MAKTVKHAISGDGVDYTLCGFADDGETCLYPTYERGDMGDDEKAAEPPIYAASGEIVTCKDCRRIIAHCKMFKRNRQP